jgi:hypothetical protein
VTGCHFHHPEPDSLEKFDSNQHDCPCSLYPSKSGLYSHISSRRNLTLLRNPLGSSIYGCICHVENMRHFLRILPKKYSKGFRRTRVIIIVVVVVVIIIIIIIIITSTITKTRAPRAGDLQRGREGERDCASHLRMHCSAARASIFGGSHSSHRTSSAQRLPRASSPPQRGNRRP